MRILFVKNELFYSDTIINELISAGCEVISIEEPTQIDERYMMELLSVVKKNNTYVMSLKYIPQLSLACGALEIGYIAWITEGYNRDNYDYSIRNPWNHIFCADQSLCKEYSEYGVRYVSFLPLAPTIKSVVREKRNSSEDTSLMVWTENIERECSFGNIMNSLMDSTKGYIDATVESRKRELSLEPIYVGLSDYIKKDIESNYPVESTRLDSVGHIYDYEYLFPHVEKSLAVANLHWLRLNENINNITIITDVDRDMKGFSRLSKDQFIQNEFEHIEEWFLNVLYSNLTNGRIITQDMWNVMMLSGQVVIPHYVDVDFLNLSDIPTFKNLFEIRDHYYYFKENREELYRLGEKVRTIVSENGDYTDRIRELLNMLEEQN